MRSARADPAAGRAAIWTGADWFVLAVLSVFATALYIWVGLALQATKVATADNIAFDFDVVRFIGLWCSDHPGTFGEAYFAARHPLALAGRPVCQAVLAVGASQAWGAVLLSALCGGAATAFAFRLARLVGAALGQAGLLTLMFATSNVALTVFAIPESYGPAMMGLTAQLLLLALAVANRRSPRSTSPGWIASGIVTLGITITNFGLTLLSAGAALLSQQLRWREVRSAAAMIAIIVVLVGAAGAVLLALIPIPNLNGPVDVVRQIWWTAHTGAPVHAPFATLLATFVFYAEIAPPLDRILNITPDLPLLLDYRSFYGGPLAMTLAVIWGVLIAGGVAAGLSSARPRILTLVAIIWVIANIALHSIWQMRGSLYLYVGHGYPAYWLLATIGWLALTARLPTALRLGALAVIVASVSMHNLAAVGTFVRAAS